MSETTDETSNSYMFPVRIISAEVKLSHSSFCWNLLNDHFVSRCFIMQLVCLDFAGDLNSTFIVSSLFFHGVVVCSCCPCSSLGECHRLFFLSVPTVITLGTFTRHHPYSEALQPFT